MLQHPTTFEEPRRTTRGKLAVSPGDDDPEAAALVAALRTGKRPAGDCESGSCDTCPCRFEEGAAQRPGKRT